MAPDVAHLVTMFAVGVVTPIVLASLVGVGLYLAWRLAGRRRKK